MFDKQNNVNVVGFPLVFLEATADDDDDGQLLNRLRLSATIKTKKLLMVYTNYGVDLLSIQ